ncbi:hypothetical protein MXB_3092 [Myxobolus squamalis]|nr:hypothetical protein MXB_3092 [Myxobolus squamalis]
MKKRDSITSVDQFCTDGLYHVKINESGLTVSKTLKAGTLDKIIDYVCYEIVDQDITDSNSISVLFATYPSFTDSQTLYEKILQRYKKYADPLQQTNEKITS